MARSETTRSMTVEEYLEFEERASGRHEYVRGQVFAMTGATEAHNLICTNLTAALHNFLRGTGCRVFQSDMKVRVEVADSFYYPDIMVTCEPYRATSVFKNSPRLIIEVLSPSTRQIDRREKLVAYKQLGSLSQYVLVHQSRMLVEVYTKQSDKQWELTKLTRTDTLALEARPDKQLLLPVPDIYENVDISAIVEEEAEEEYDLCSS